MVNPLDDEFRDRVNHMKTNKSAEYRLMYYKQNLWDFGWKTDTDEYVIEEMKRFYTESLDEEENDEIGVEELDFREDITIYDYIEDWYLN